VNWYLAAALVLQVALIPCAWVCWRFDPEHRVVALGLTGTVQALALLCLAVGYREPGRALSGAISDVLLVAGLVIVVCSCAGMAVFDDPLDRLHLVTPAAMLGSTGICASIVVRYGLTSSGLAALGVAAILVAANPLTGHAVGRAIAIRRGAVWSDPADAASAPSGTQGGSSSGDEQ
jgi:multisubunit Na+/H+ antiporter MnhG subunit